MNWFHKAVDRGIKQGVEKAVNEFVSGGALDRIIREALADPKYDWFRFVKHMQARMMEVDKTLPARKALDLARNAYRDFLHDEDIQFGAPAFDWSEDGARDLIQSYEIDHWETAP
jgi:hypothetical protein